MPADSYAFCRHAIARCEAIDARVNLFARMRDTADLDLAACLREMQAAAERAAAKGCPAAARDAAEMATPAFLSYLRAKLGAF
jgi:hypothetical protein